MDQREYEIDLREIFRMIRKKVWIIIVLVVISVGVSGAISYFVLEPVFETSTTLMVGKASNEEAMIQYSDILLNQKLVKTYGEIIKSRSILKQVIQKLNLNVTTEELIRKIIVSPVKDTEIVQIKVSDTNPELAKDIANKLAEVFMKDVKRIMKVDNVQVIDKAEITFTPVKPRPKINMIIAGFLGSIVGLGIIFLIEFLDNTIKTPDDISRYLDIPIIGIIPDIDKKTDKKSKKRLNKKVKA